jgi:hypothetical protein
MAPLRAALGLLAVFFGHYLGRSAARLLQGKEARGRTVTWALRTAVCAAAILWGHGLDLLAGVVAVAVAVSLGAGVYAQLHPPKDEGLVKMMFPKE